MKRRLKEEEVSSVIKEVGKLSVLDHVNQKKLNDPMAIAGNNAVVLVLL